MKVKDLVAFVFLWEYSKDAGKALIPAPVDMAAHCHTADSAVQCVTVEVALAGHYMTWGCLSAPASFDKTLVIADGVGQLHAIDPCSPLTPLAFFDRLDLRYTFPRTH